MEKLKNNYDVGRKVCVTDPLLPKRSYGEYIWICMFDDDQAYSYRREAGFPEREHLDSFPGCSGDECLTNVVLGNILRGDLW